MFTVLFDMDDVLLNTVTNWVDSINKKYGTNVKIEDVVDWDITVPFPNLKKSDIFSILSEREFWKKVGPTKDSIEILRSLNRQSNIDLYIVTAAIPKTFIVKYEECFRIHFPFIKSKQIICCNNKHLIDGDFIIDDNADNFRQKTDYQKLPKRILFDRPWNKNEPCSKYDYRAYCMKDVMSIINNFTRI